MILECDTSSISFETLQALYDIVSIVSLGVFLKVFFTVPIVYWWFSMCADVINNTMLQTDKLM